MPRVTLTSKCQITVPKEIREREHLKPGDKLDFFYGPDGALRIRPASLSVDDVAGCLHRPGMKARTVEEMDEGIAEYMRRKYGKKRG